MLNPIEEAKFAELRDKCRDLKVPAPPQIMIGLKVHDRDGVLVFDDVQRGHSWTRNFYNALAMRAMFVVPVNTNFGAGYISAKETNGSINGTYSQLLLQADKLHSVNFYSSPAGYAQGIVVGTGDTAFNVEQYALAAIIPHGTGAGQFSYVAGNAVVQTYASKVWKAIYSRVMNNNSGGSITVKEAGIYPNFSSSITWMLERSVLAPTVPVPNGAQLTVTYEISMDFSAID
jgi:hypothetical protein